MAYEKHWKDFETAFWEAEVNVGRLRYPRSAIFLNHWLVAVTGDVVDSDKHHRWVIPVLGRLRWRLAAFAILGNHDSWRDPTLIRRRVLRRLWRRSLRRHARLELLAPAVQQSPLA